MALTAGGTDGTTTLRVVTANGDGKNGCNLTGQTTLVVSVHSSAPGVATASLGTAVDADTFTSCEAAKTVSVDPLTEGQATITVTQVSNSTGGSFNFAPATFTVNVSAPTPTNTKPSVAVTGVTDGSTYEIGSVPVARCSVTDDQDGPSSKLAIVTGTLSHGLGAQTATCNHTDSGGLAADTATATYTIVDTGDPTITHTLSPASPNANGWYNTAVDVDFTCADVGGSGIQSCTGDTTLGNGANQSVTGIATDWSDNTSKDEVTGINVDTLDPNAPTASRNPAANSAGWNKSDVTVHFTSDGDNGDSGVESCTADVPVTTETIGQVVSGTCTDRAGNVSDAAQVTVKLDKTEPSVNLSGGPADGDSYYFGSVPAAPTCTASDATPGSGLADADSFLADMQDCQVTGGGTAVGPHTWTATATDNAGNTSTARSLQVVAWTMTGFYAPVDKGIHNTVKGGNTVPLKFELFAGSTELTDVAAVSLHHEKVNCDGGLPTDSVEMTSTVAPACATT